MTELNPFPDYPVVLLKAEASTVGQDTIVTPAIRFVRDEILKPYTNQWLARREDKLNEVKPAVVAVRGDYGTGKTHLLVDAAAQVKASLSDAYPDLTILRVACLQTDPLTWFRLNIGPELKPVNPRSQRRDAGFVEKIMLRLYAEAGQVIAAKVNLTQAAVQKLKEQPESIRALIREDLISISAVEEELDDLLEETCPGTDERIRRALVAAGSGDSAALRWLAGETLSDSEKNHLQLPASLKDETDAAQVLIALAAIHFRLEIPFVFMIDELEHLTRYDLVLPQSRGNLNWLKRLLEGLADYKSLVFVSGHWSAWEAESDYLQRFTQWRPVELVKLTAEDVVKIVHARVPASIPPPQADETPASATNGDDSQVKPFTISQAQIVAEVSNGNIRRVLSLCRALFRASNGFRQELTPQLIQQVGVQVGQRVTIEDALMRLHEILERLGLTVQSQGATQKGVGFDLIAYEGNRLLVVADVKHAVHQTDQHDQVKFFIDRVEEVHKDAPEVIGCFIADGNVDDHLMSILNASRPFKILWYDLTTTDALKRLTADLQTTLRGDAKGVVNPAPAGQLDAQKIRNEELLAQLEDGIKSATANANAGLVTQLEEQRRNVSDQLAELNNQISLRDEALRQEFLSNLRNQIENSDRKLADQMERLNARLDAQRVGTGSQRDQGLLAKQEGEEVPKLHATYAELTRAPSFSRKLRLALAGPQLIAVFLCLVCGPTVILLSDVIAESFFGYGRSAYLLSRITLSIVGLALVLNGALVAWMRLSKVESFFEFSNRTLREIYVRSRSAEDLIRADRVLRESLDRFGPVEGKRRAREEFRF